MFASHEARRVAPELHEAVFVQNHTLSTSSDACASTTDDDEFEVDEPRRRWPTRDERNEEQRQRILDAATQLYGERGYYSTRVEDIAARARTSRRTVYAHYKNLEELRFAIYERAVARTLVDVAR